MTIAEGTPMPRYFHFAQITLWKLPFFSPFLSLFLTHLSSFSFISFLTCFCCISSYFFLSAETPLFLFIFLLLLFLSLSSGMFHVFFLFLCTLLMFLFSFIGVFYRVSLFLLTYFFLFRVFCIFTNFFSFFYKS